MLKRLVNEARFTLTLETTGPVLVRSGRATLSGPDMTPVLTYRNNDWQVYLPGSSLKGVLRSHVEKVSRTLRHDPFVVCNPFNTKGEPDEFCGMKLEKRKKQKDQAEPITNEVAYSASCPVCRLFGSTEFIGRISINDAYLVNDQIARPVESRDGVGIDRLTGGAAHGALFNLEVVSSGVEFQTAVYLRNFEIWQLGMMMLAVQDLEDGLIRIGSGRSRGLGSMKGNVDEVQINHLGVSANKPANEIWGLGKFLGDNSYGTKSDDLLQSEQIHQVKTRGIRQEATFTGESLQELQTQSIQAFVKRLKGWSSV